MVETRDEQMQTQMRQRLHELQLEHRDLDTAIHRIADNPSHDQLALTRMKRRKLLLKTRSPGSRDNSIPISPPETQPSPRAISEAPLASSRTATQRITISRETARNIFDAK